MEIEYNFTHKTGLNFNYEIANQTVIYFNSMTI